MSSRKATESFCFVHTMQYIYEEDKKSALEHLVRQAMFKFWALWSVRDGKGLNVQHVVHTAASTHVKYLCDMQLHKERRRLTWISGSYSTR